MAINDIEKWTEGRHTIEKAFDVHGTSHLWLKCNLRRIWAKRSKQVKWIGVDARAFHRKKRTYTKRSQTKIRRYVRLRNLRQLRHKINLIDDAVASTHWRVVRSTPQQSCASHQWNQLMQKGRKKNTYSYLIRRLADIDVWSNMYAAGGTIKWITTRFTFAKEK